MSEKFDRVNQLIPFYQQLLTEKQRLILNYYYGEDLSLSEIGELLNISRNGVYDTLKKSVALLEEYEEKLHLSENYDFRVSVYREINDRADHDIKELVNKLIQKEEQ